ncbi:MAG TPA: glycosyltransferase family 4 protein [Ktedonobacteraceae bacterium]|nr:glycosyltransferase family 4 protein [Ktedonobacteraceae bacterium]
MRILMLSQFFYPPTVGGEERFVTDLSHELAARGHDVAVVTLWQQGFPAFEVQQGVRIHRVRGTMQQMSFLFSEGVRTYSPPFPDPGVMGEIRRILQIERPEIVHAHNWLVHSFTPLAAESKAKFVVSLHDYSHVCVQKRLMRQGVRCTGPEVTKCLACSTQFYGLTKGPATALANFHWAAKERQVVDMFLPVSQATADGNELEKHKVPYQVIPNFVPDHMDVLDDENDPLLSQLPKGDFLLFVGDVTLDKGAEVLIRAYAEMETQIPLVLIGRPFLPNLDAWLPKNVFLLGTWPHEAVMGAWKRCTIGLVPSTWAEPFGIVALEAMYMGKPLIAARSGGLTDIVAEGETGLFVPPGDPQALRAAIQTLLDDPALRERMGVQAKQRVQAFQAEFVVSRFEQVYQELLDKDSADITVEVTTGNRKKS